MFAAYINENINDYYKKYSGHSKAVGICWALLTICFLIINIICFFEPQWIGDSETSEGTGWIGLYKWCELFNSGKNEICQGAFQDFSTIMSDAFKASTFFIGVSILIIFLCIFCFILFFFKSIYRHGYLVCGSLQLVSTVFMFLGCVIYPHGWDNIYVQRICGEGTYRFHIGECSFRWAYMLAIIGIFIDLMLTILAFTLAYTTANKMKKYKQELDPPRTESIAARSTLALNAPGTMQTAASSKGGSRRQLQSEPGYYPDDSMKARNMSYGDYPPTNGSGMLMVRDAGYTGSRKQGNGSYGY